MGDYDYGAYDLAEVTITLQPSRCILAA
jgi:hypothetical protein